MSRKFITARELRYIDTINKQLIQHVIGQVVHYFSISLPETRVHGLYNEAIKKTWSPPVHCNALVLWDNPSTKSTAFAPDSDYTLEVYFHTAELTDRNLRPKEGDFIEFGQVFFEISAVTQPQIVFGEIQDRIMTKCSCVKAREGQFAAGGVSSEDVDNTHPVADPVCCPECASNECGPEES